MNIMVMMAKTAIFLTPSTTTLTNTTGVRVITGSVRAAGEPRA